MEWTDEAIVLSARPHGEAAVVATLLARAQGRHAGLVPGGRSPRRRAALEAGTLVEARWRARLADQLGTLTLEPVRQTAAAFLDDPARLAALSAVCAVAEAALPERAPHPAVYAGTRAMLDALPSDAWAPAYVRWELGLAAELGFGLDLSACAATGAVDDLAYVSPRTGRAVSRGAGAPYADRLLRLPGFLAGTGEADAAALLDGLALGAWALERQGGVALPAARRRLVDRFQAAARSGSVGP